MWRLWLIVAWFVALFAWYLSPAWAVGSDLSDVPRLLLIALRRLATPGSILLSIAVIVLVFMVNFKNRPQF